jgi:hypothetical protein
MTFPRPSTGIARTLAFWFCASSVVLTLILAQIIGSVATDTLRDQIGQELSDLAYQTTDKLDHGMFERYREVQLMANNAGMGDPAVPITRKQMLLDDIQNSYSYFAWFGMADTSGKVLAAALMYEFVTQVTEPERSLQATYIPDFASDGGVAGIYILVSDISE